MITWIKHLQIPCSIITASPGFTEALKIDKIKVQAQAKKGDPELESPCKLWVVYITTLSHIQKLHDGSRSREALACWSHRFRASHRSKALALL